jgi:hypothetical protein
MTSSGYILFISWGVPISSIMILFFHSIPFLLDQPSLLHMVLYCFLDYIIGIIKTAFPVCPGLIDRFHCPGISTPALLKVATTLFSSTTIHVKLSETAFNKSSIKRLYLIFY